MAALDEPTQTPVDLDADTHPIAVPWRLRAWHWVDLETRPVRLIAWGTIALGVFVLATVAGALIDGLRPLAAMSAERVLDTRAIPFYACLGLAASGAALVAAGTASRSGRARHRICILASAVMLCLCSVGCLALELAALDVFGPWRGVLIAFLGIGLPIGLIMLLWRPAVMDEFLTPAEPIPVLPPIVLATGALVAIGFGLFAWGYFIGPARLHVQSARSALAKGQLDLHSLLAGLSVVSAALAALLVLASFALLCRVRFSAGLCFGLSFLTLLVVLAFLAAASYVPWAMPELEETIESGGYGDGYTIPVYAALAGVAVLLILLTRSTGVAALLRRPSRSDESRFWARAATRTLAVAVILWGGAAILHRAADEGPSPSLLDLLLRGCELGPLASVSLPAWALPSLLHALLLASGVGLLFAKEGGRRAAWVVSLGLALGWSLATVDGVLESSGTGSSLGPWVYPGALGILLSLLLRAAVLSRPVTRACGAGRPVPLKRAAAAMTLHRTVAGLVVVASVVGVTLLGRTALLWYSSPQADTSLTHVLTSGLSACALAYAAMFFFAWSVLLGWRAGKAAACTMALLLVGVGANLALLTYLQPLPLSLAHCFSRLVEYSRPLLLLCVATPLLINAAFTIGRREIALTGLSVDRSCQCSPPLQRLDLFGSFLGAAVYAWLVVLCHRAQVTDKIVWPRSIPLLLIGFALLCYVVNFLLQATFLGSPAYSTPGILVLGVAASSALLIATLVHPDAKQSIPVSDYPARAILAVSVLVGLVWPALLAGLAWRGRRESTW